MYMILLILHDTDLTSAVLQAWTDAGAPGITLLQSTGLAKLRSEFGLRDDFPILPSLTSLFEEQETLNQTMFTMVRGHEAVDLIVKATQNVTGDLNLPNTGILAVIQLAEVYGLDRKDNPDEHDPGL